MIIVKTILDTKHMNHRIRTTNKSEIAKFKKWLEKKGCQILPVTNEYECVRFKGAQTGVLYNSGKVSNPFTQRAINAFKTKKRFDGAPISTGRFNSYRKQKQAILKRDGSNCFCCGYPLGEDITLEHVVSLNRGGKNELGNMALVHEGCNKLLGHKTVVDKMEIIIQKRMQFAELQRCI